MPLFRCERQQHPVVETAYWHDEVPDSWLRTEVEDILHYPVEFFITPHILRLMMILCILILQSYAVVPHL